MLGALWQERAVQYNRWHPSRWPHPSISPHSEIVSCLPHKTLHHHFCPFAPVHCALQTLIHLIPYYMWSWYYCGLYFIIRKLNHEETNNLSKVIQLVKIVSLNFIFWPSVTLHILSTWLYLLPWPSSFLPFGITSFCLPQDLPIAMTILTWDFPVIPHVQNPTELYGNSQREPDPSLLIISQLTPHVVTTDNNDCNVVSLSSIFTPMLLYLEFLLDR